ncbi:MAG: OmpH family outer membrane protein [Deltaproteobacteria bacterium]|nr:OmpH family outer membrane protein [Candidatus Anaeroferrophillacea bacterium]
MKNHDVKMIRVMVFVLLVLFALAAPLPVAAAEGAKIAFIDLQKVMAMSEAGKQARETLEGKRGELAQEIKGKEMELNRAKEEIERQAMMLSEAARAEKEAEYQKQVRDFKLFVSDSEQELKNTYKELTKSMLKDLEKVVLKVGNDGKFDMILGKQESSIFFASERLDITGKVIDAYNAWVKNPPKNDEKAK